ncbi:type II toxin-antitoxin system RelE/ParE family toxin [Enterovibrio calviensis]|uniref:type II toxin-antitoxin system RelE/ParE family toxin n=1 Tax=Enterovibrio calviensis TaxID=91359 RepID=UPI003736DC62
MNQSNIASKKVTVELTEAFRKSADNTIAYLGDHMGELQAVEHIQAVYESFEGNVTDNPYMYRSCPDLRQLGVNTYREFIFNGLRIIYEVEEQQDSIVVTALLFLTTRQSIQKQMVDYYLFQS